MLFGYGAASTKALELLRFGVGVRQAAPVTRLPDWRQLGRRWAELKDQPSSATTLPASLYNNTIFVEYVQLRAVPEFPHDNTWTVLVGIIQSRDFVYCNHVHSRQVVLRLQLHSMCMFAYMIASLVCGTSQCAVTK